mgnify:CR=1 FL=1
MNQEEIKKILPHRDHMLLIDEAELREGKAYGKKTIRGDEFFLQGHFPGNPVCPGVCHIEMLRECVMKLVGVKVFISSVKQCRLTAVSDPLSCSELKLTVSLEKTDEGYAVSALLEDEEKTYMEYRGSMAVDL